MDEIPTELEIAQAKEIKELKQKFLIAKTTLEAVLVFIVPDNCRKMVSEALNELNNRKT